MFEFPWRGPGDPELRATNGLLRRSVHATVLMLIVVLRQLSSYTVFRSEISCKLERIIGKLFVYLKTLTTFLHKDKRRGKSKRFIDMIIWECPLYFRKKCFNTNFYLNLVARLELFPLLANQATSVATWFLSVGQTTGCLLQITGRFLADLLQQLQIYNLCSFSACMVYSRWDLGQPCQLCFWFRDNEPRYTPTASLLSFDV